MKVLLAAINAKYIHSNLGVYYLKTYAEQHMRRHNSENQKPEITIREYTINNRTDEILKDIYNQKPDMLGFSCYIWNISMVQELIHDIVKILPQIHIWLGGPEVSYNPEEILNREPYVYGIMMGEGEDIFSEVLSSYRNGNLDFTDVSGVAVRGSDGEIYVNSPAAAVDMSQIPFPYDEIKGFENRIIYYESSRGCPFACSYCLSSVEKAVRFRNLELVKAELDFFLSHEVPQVKFVDRTFNCNKKHAIEIWKYLLEQDNGITNFHFEISADLLDEEELTILSRMRPGLIQLEIGVQTTNSRTIAEIKRKTNLDLLKKTVEKINGFQNIHQHLDLIAGLPYEDYHSFGESFNQVYFMRPNQLQMGFLKVLKGSYMSAMTKEYHLVYKESSPFEVLSTKWLSYDEILRLKAIEDMVEVYYNSGQFTTVTARLETEFASPFAMFEALAQYYERHGLFQLNHSRMARYEILNGFITAMWEDEQKIGAYQDLLVYDLYLRENVKSRPSFGWDQSPYKEVVRAFFEKEAKNPRYLKGYEGYESRQISKMAHLEVFRDKSMVLFDYKQRDALTYNARAQIIKEEEHGQKGE